MRRTTRFLTGLAPILAAAGLAGAAMIAPAHSQGLGGMMGAATKVAAAATVSDAEIVSYFSQMSDEMDRQNTIPGPKNPYAVRLAKLTTGLATHDGLKLDIKPYIANEVNAFAMGDGTVRVYSGLMDKMTDDEVRCVIGHEIGHVKLDHGKKRMKSALQKDAALSVASDASSGVRQLANSQLGGLILNVINAQYSQAAEIEADDYALTFMAAKKYPQAACPAAMDKLAALGGSGGGIALLKTHPDPAARAKRMRAKIT